MNKYFLLLSFLILTSLTFGQTIHNRPTGDWLSEDWARNPLWRWLVDADNVIGGAKGTGNTYYVDSNVSHEGDGSSWTDAKNTLNEAIDLCTANNGDYIYVAQGHTESYTAADGFDADVAGITITGCGNGANRPTFTFADTDADVAVGAANVTLYNLRFAAGISAVVRGISIEAAGDDCAIIGCEFPEPTTSSWEFVRAILVASGVDNLLLRNNKAYSADAIGATNWVDLDSGVNNGTMIIGNIIMGEYAEGVIHSDQIDLETYLIDNVITNMTSGIYAIEFTANATGQIVNCKVATNALATAIDPGKLAVDDSTVWTKYGTADQPASPIFDRLIATADSDNPANSSIIAHLASKTEDWSTFDPATDSLEALRDFLAAMTAMQFYGTCLTNAVATTVISTDLTGFGNDYFNTDWVCVVLYDAGGAGAAPEGEIRDITDYVSSSGTFTVAAFSAAVTVSDKVMIGRRELYVDIAAILADTSVDDPIIQDLAGISQIGDKVQADMDANSVLANGTYGLSALKTLIDAVDNFVDTEVAAIKLITDDLAGISELGDKVQADMDANSVLANGTYGLSALKTLIDTVDNFVDTEVTSIKTITDDLAGISEIGDKVVADMDANSVDLNAILTDTAAIDPIVADLAGISEIGDKIVADMDANSTMSGIALDHVVGVADGTGVRPASVVNNSILAYLMSYSGTAAVADYNNMTMSLPALANLIESSLGAAGRIFFVDSVIGTDGAGYGDTWATPYDSIDYASSKCTANNGDVILLAPGHDDALAAAQITLAEAGVTIIGTGRGNDMAKVTFNNALSSVVVTAASISIYNMRFVASIDAVAIGIDLSGGTGDNFRLQDCIFSDDASTDEFTDSVNVSAGNDDVKIIGCEFNQAGAGASAAINAPNIQDALWVENCRFQGNFSSAVIFSNAVNTNVLLKDCTMKNDATGVHCIEFTAAATGEIANCKLSGDTWGAILDPGSMRVHRCTQSVAIDSAAIDVPLVPGQTYSLTTPADEITQDLFDIQNGPILITSFVGLVDVLIGANVTTCKILIDVDAGAAYDYDLSTAVAIETDVAGVMYVFSNANPSVLTPLTPAASGANILMSGWYCQEGMLEQLMSADPGGAVGDHITWRMTFIPLANNVVVVPQ